MASSTTLDEILGKATSVHLKDEDVVFGRGGFANRHRGNQEYLKLISEHEEAYMDCKRKYQKLLSLCIIHQLRCKGVRFLKKDEKSGKWKTVQLSQCRLKISQRLRERAPFIKLEHMKASAGPTKAFRPLTSLSAAAGTRVRESRPVPPPSDVLPVDIITVTDASSDEDDGMESIGFDDCSLNGCSSISLQPAFEGTFSCLEFGDSTQTEEEQYVKRYAESMFDIEYPPQKRPRTVSVGKQEDYVDTLLKEAALLDDISVSSFDVVSEEDMIDFGLGLDESLYSGCIGPSDEMAEYLQGIF